MATKDEETRTSGVGPAQDAGAAPPPQAASDRPPLSEWETAGERRTVTVEAVSAAGLLAAEAPATNLTSELNNIDFRKMISGPLQAAVDAQVASSLATIDFINRVGFTTTGEGASAKRELVMVDFTHERKDLDAEGKAQTSTVTVKVPLLAMLPIPSLRIEHVIIDFNVKLNAVESQSVSDELGVEAEVKAGWGPVSFKVAASYQRSTTTNVEVKREYALSVNVKAVQDEIPAGLERILNMVSA